MRFASVLTLALLGCTPPVVVTPPNPEPEQPTADPQVATTAAGLVRGATTDGVVRFLGIPYAAPPVGALRWKPPTAAMPWTGVRSATAFGSACVQSAALEGPGSEDCLFLNVWTPQVRATTLRPVMVYIHGGGWARGAGNMSVFEGIENMQDGPAVAKKEDVVVVTLNYRLANLGFLAHPALASGTSAAGNYGLMDAIAALAWVKANIREFGGDPARVLVYGTSAGGSMSCAVAASPSARGLFSVMASHSGGGCDCFRDDQKLAVASLVAERVGCRDATDVAACLRQVPAATFVDLPGVGATVDGTVLTACPRETFQAGRGPEVPLVFGTNLHEGIGYLSDAARALTWTSLEQLFHRSFGATEGAALTALYDSRHYDNATAAWLVFAGDYVYHCPDRRILRALGTRTWGTYRYLFAGALSDPRHAAKLATHGMDVPFVFRNFGTLTTTAAERALSDSMAHTWATMASTGRPTADGSWAVWNDRGASLALGLDATAMIEGFRATECDALDRVPALRDQPADQLPFPSP